jgi:hypothetical protein
MNQNKLLDINQYKYCPPIKNDNYLELSEISLLKFQMDLLSIRDELKPRKKLILDRMNKLINAISDLYIVIRSEKSLKSNR